MYHLPKRSRGFQPPSEDVGAALGSKQFTIHLFINFYWVASIRQMKEMLPSLVTLTFRKWKICSLLSKIQQRQEEQRAEMISALGGTRDTCPLRLCSDPFILSCTTNIKTFHKSPHKLQVLIIFKRPNEAAPQRRRRRFSVGVHWDSDKCELK